VLVLETQAHARARGATPRGWVEAQGVGYRPHLPGAAAALLAERLTDDAGAEHLVAAELGPAALPVALGAARPAGVKGRLTYALESRDGYAANGLWVLA